MRVEEERRASLGLQYALGYRRLTVCYDPRVMLMGIQEIVDRMGENYSIADKPSRLLPRAMVGMLAVLLGNI